MGWRQRLQSPDLAAREVAFDRIVQLALGSPAVRAWLRHLALDASQGELAWTARLALRELALVGELAAAAQVLADPSLAAGALSNDADQETLRAWLDAWGRELGPGLETPSAPEIPPHGIQVEHDGTGCRVRVVEVVEGVEQVREFRGASLQDVLQQHPELELRFGLRTLGRERPIDRLEDGATGFDPAVFGVYVSQLDASTRERLELPAEEGGLLVLGTASGTYAHALGITVGDVLVELDGNLLRGLEDISLIMAQRRPDDPIDVRYYDNWGRLQALSWVAPAARSGADEGADSESP